MAGVNVCKILLVLGVLTHHGFGETLDLTVTPTKTSQLSSEDVYISCRPGTSLQAKSILLIKIRKSGDSSPLAHVYHNHQAVVKNPNTTRGIKAVGHIDENALRESFLSMKLEDPTYEQSGSYECELAYLDVKGKMKVAKTSGDVKVIKPDIRAVDGVIDDLREEDERLNHNSSNQAKINKEQEKKIKTNAKDFASFTSCQAKINKEHEKKIKTNAQDFESVSKELRETKAELHNQASSTQKLLKALTQELHETKAELQNQASSTQKLLKALTQEFHETKAKLHNKKELKCLNDEWTRVDYNLCYKAYTTKATWQKASETCRKEGGTLVSIYNKFHNDTANRVARSVGINSYFWIGLNDIAEEGKFVFDDGTQIKKSSYTNWALGQPDNHGNEDCVVLWYNGDWNDVRCSGTSSFVCQTSTRPKDVW